jgi:hypothetical protein
MCVISNKIKFCTCVDDDIDIEELNHYWVLHSYNKNKNLEVMGVPALPGFLNPLFDINEELLISTLNTPDAFDKDLALKRGNRLEIVLCNQSTAGEEALYFNFKYTGKIWKSIEADTFDLMSRFDEIQQGEIKEID